MAARSSMSTLITRVRALISDTAGATQTFSDDEIEDVLDARRDDIRYEFLTPVDTIAAGGSITWLTWYGGANWESSATFTDSSYNAITPTAADYMIGKFDFATHQASGVLITGYMYDVYGAAADMLDLWSAKLKLGVDFTADGATFHLSQRLSLFKQLAQDYRGKSTSSGVVHLRRSDVNCK